MFHKVLHRAHTRSYDHFSARKQRIFTFLRENSVGVLSTVTANGDPHGTVIYFQINEDFTVSFLTKKGTRKYDNLVHNPHVMLTVFEPARQATCQVIGTARELTDSIEINALAGTILGISLHTSEAGTPPISKLEAGGYAAFVIKPVQIRMAVYNRPESSPYGELFESIESFELEGAGT